MAQGRIRLLARRLRLVRPENDSQAVLGRFGRSGGYAGEPLRRRCTGVLRAPGEAADDYNTGVDWPALLEREQARYADGEARLEPAQLVRMGNAAYGAGLALLMLGRDGEAGDWLARAAERWRESWEHAAPDSWGRPVGTVKAWLIAGRDAEAEDAAGWALGLGAADAGSAIGRYAAVLALLALGRWADAARTTESLRGREDFPAPVADTLAAIVAGDAAAYARAADAVLVSFETRADYLEDAAVADTVLALHALARRRGLAVEPAVSPVLPPAARG
jgi:hypothetical protein